MILFCIPYAGGGAEAFAGWRKELADVADVRIAALPGRGERFGEPLIDDMPRLVAELTGQCADFRDEPFAVLGHSFGAVAAYALTLHLQREGRAPTQLFVSGARPPFLPLNRPKRHLMSDAEVIEELAMFEGTDNEVLNSPELMSVYMPILRADFKVFETYRPDRERVGVPVSVFGGDRDMFVPLDDLDRWKELGGAKTTVRVYEGGHFFIGTQRQSVCRAVRADLLQSELTAPPVH